MKITILFLFFTAALFPAAALGGCPEGGEACSASAKKNSVFLKTVEAAQKASSPAEAGQKAVPANPPKTPVSVTDAAAAPKSAESAQGGPSKPVWLLLVGGGLAALYYYLKEEKRKGRKK